MKFTCEKNALVSAISVASRTVAQKSTIPALEGIYIRAGVKLTLSGYNLETGITISVDAEIQQTGACIMPSRLFFDIIRKLPGDTVSISVDEKFKVSIRGGISSFSITAMSSEDYPELPEVESDKGISLPQNELKAMIGGTSFAVSENQARPIHTGCLFEVEDSSITVVAVDGYRLALRRWKSEEPIGRTLKFVVPAAALKEAEKILGDTDEACTFFLGSKHILFTIGEATLVCRLLEGEFLDWRRVLPQNQPVKLAVNVAKMTDSIERVGLIISEKLKSPVRCKFGENTADFRSVSTIGEAHDVCQIAGDGQDMEIGFNCRYLLDALRALGIVHFAEKADADQTYLERFAALSRLITVLEEQGVSEVEAETLDDDQFKVLFDELNACLERKKALEAERAAAVSACDTLAGWGSFSPAWGR